MSGFAGDIGVGQVDITPPVGVRNKNWGPSEQETALSVHRPLVATAVAFRSGSQVQMLMGMDGTWWRRVDDEKRVRTAVLAALNLPEQCLLIALSHTHAGCVLSSSVGALAGGVAAVGYLDHLADALIAAARQALADLRPGTVDWLTGHCELAANRESVIDGKPWVAWNPDGIADSTVSVGRVCGPAGQPRATVVSYACHPTTLAWQNTVLSPDYVGAMRELVERETGAPVLFLQGASGDLAPREQYTGDLSVADRHGHALGYAVLAALATAPAAGTDLALVGMVESGAPLGIWAAKPVTYATELTASCEWVQVPLQPVATEAELQEQWGEIDPRSLTERLDRLRDLREGYLSPGMTSVPHPVWAWRIGDAMFAAHPGEAYSVYATGLRQAFPGRPVWAVNLCNGPGFGYFPDAAAYQRRAYQTWQTPFAATALPTLTRASRQALAALLD